MYLFIYADKRVRQVHDNLSIADHLAVKKGLLTVVRFDVAKSAYTKLVHDNDRAYWVPILEAQSIVGSAAKIHQ